MRMRPLSLLLLASACAASAAASSPGPRPDPRPRPPVLRGSQCLDPDFVRSFVAVDDQHLLVDTGRNRYRMEVSRSCWSLRYTSFIGFRGDPIFNRVCGTAFDALILRDGIPCRIQRMELLSKEQYKQAIAEREAERLAQRARRKQRK